MSELVKTKDNQLILAEDVVRELKEFNDQKLKMDMKEKELKEALLKAMNESGVKSFENDNVKITFKEAYVRNGVDITKMKEQGIYEVFLKETPVKASVAISWK